MFLDCDLRDALADCTTFRDAVYEAEASGELIAPGTWEDLGDIARAIVDELV